MEWFSGPGPRRGAAHPGGCLIMATNHSQEKGSPNQKADEIVADEPTAVNCQSTTSQSTTQAPNSTSRWRWTLSGVAIGFVFFWFALRYTDIDGAWDALEAVKLPWLLVVVAAGALFIAAKSWRWAVLLKPLFDGQFGLLHRSIYVGTAANLVIAHTGELARASLVGKRVGQPVSTILGSIALERVLDFIALSVLAGLALLLEPRVSDLLWTATMVGMVIAAVGVLVLVNLVWPGARARAMGHGALKLLPEKAVAWLTDKVTKGRKGLIALQDLRTCLWVLALSVVQWLFIVLAIWACAQAVGVSIALHAAITVFVLTVIGLTLPSSPAQLGTVQLAFVAGLALMGQESASAFAASLVYVVMVNGAMMVIGAVFWLRWQHNIAGASDSNVIVAAGDKNGRGQIDTTDKRLKVQR